MRAATGQELRDAGIQLTLSLQSEDWKDLYRFYVSRWFASKGSQFRFTGEALRFAALSHGIDQPSHHNAWAGAASSFIRVWLRSGQIQVIGFRNAESPKTHAHSLREYQKV